MTRMKHDKINILVNVRVVLVINIRGNTVVKSCESTPELECLKELNDDLLSIL